VGKIELGARDQLKQNQEEGRITLISVHENDESTVGERAP